MNRADAIQIALFINDLQKGRYAPALFHGESEKATNVGEVWLTQLEAEDDAQLVTDACIALYNAPEPPGGRKPITPADLREAMRKLKRDRRAATPKVEEAEFAREIEPWVKGWLVARYVRKDMRVWPQQKEGYDTMQNTYPHTRTYVWGDQEQMPEEERGRYEQEGASLTVDTLRGLISRALHV